MRICRLLSLIVVSALPAAALAQTYPSKPVRLVVPFAAGGALDVVGRVIGAKLGESWGRQVIIENRLGAAGNSGAEYVAKARPGELNYFSSGTGTGTHLAAALFDQLAGVRTMHVPYKGGAQGIEPVGSTPEQFAAFIKTSVAKYSKLVKELGVKPE